MAKKIKEDTGESSPKSSILKMPKRKKPEPELERVIIEKVPKTSKEISDYLELWKKNKTPEFLKKVNAGASNNTIMVFMPNFGKMKELSGKIDGFIYIDGYRIDRKYPVEVKETPLIKIAIVAKLLGFSRINNRVLTRIKKYEREMI